MQLPQPKLKFNLKVAEESLLREDRFISNLFSLLPIPISKKLQDEKMLLPDSEESAITRNAVNQTNRASSLVELQKRLQFKRKLTVKEKLKKKNVKNKIRKNEKRDERNAQKKLARAAQNEFKQSQNLAEKTENSRESTNNVTETKKPVFNKDGKMVFSKFDFSEVGKQKHQKTEKDPKKILKRLEQQKEKLKKLEESGETEKVALVKEKSAWKAALAKAEGQKLKDDPLLLKKSVEKKEQLKRRSIKMWEQRKERVKKAKEEKEKRRVENIEKRKERKKANKLKRAAKKGKITL